MKKIIIIVLILILAVISYFMIGNNFSIGKISIKNVGDIKALDEQLKSEIDVANKKTSQEYESELNNLRVSIKNLAIAKENYQKYNDQEESGIIKIETYKIEYLWAIIGQYAKKRNTQLSLDLLETAEPNIYDLSFSLTGDYEDIVDCLSDIEDNNAFNFKVTNFEMKPYTKVVTKTEVSYFEVGATTSIGTETSQTTLKQNPYDGIQTVQETDDATVASSYNPKQLVATFQIKNVGIDFN